MTFITSTNVNHLQSQFEFITATAEVKRREEADVKDTPDPPLIHTFLL